MRTYLCSCGNTLFFDNSLCLRCQRELGFCPRCRNLSPLQPSGPAWVCGNASCGTPLVKCANYQQHGVCNWCVAAPDGIVSGAPLCNCCQYTETIPDLSVEGNLNKWRRLESAKRRLFYDLDQLGLPYGTKASGFRLPLRFDFLADTVVKTDVWHTMGEQERVFTGHHDGRITINVREADDVERERLRTDFGEAHRTLIGHFRHEIGHYYWQLLIAQQREDACAAAFGDHRQLAYADALQRYYTFGPPADWRSWYVSAYAAMHPWEDFAETLATFFDLASSLDTAVNVGFLPRGSAAPWSDFDAAVAQYAQLGVAMNEMNRSMGLIDLVPEVLVPAVVEKMRYIHQLCTETAPTVAGNT